MVKTIKKSKFMYWSPRILSIIFILFLSFFSLDIFGNNYTFWQTVVGLFMHNIPSLILLILLTISWKHELVGGITFISAGLLYMIITAVAGLIGEGFKWYYLTWNLIIAGPAFLIGILWYLNWKKKRK